MLFIYSELINGVCDAWSNRPVSFLISREADWINRFNAVLYSSWRLLKNYFCSVNGPISLVKATSRPLFFQLLCAVNSTSDSDNTDGRTEVAVDGLNGLNTSVALMIHVFIALCISMRAGVFMQVMLDINLANTVEKLIWTLSHISYVGKQP